MRPPPVFVRPLAPAEGERLKQLSRHAKHSKRQRGQSCSPRRRRRAREIADMWMTDESHVLGTHMLVSCVR